MSFTRFLSPAYLLELFVINIYVVLDVRSVENNRLLFPPQPHTLLRRFLFWLITYGLILHRSYLRTRDVRTAVYIFAGMFNAWVGYAFVAPVVNAQMPFEQGGWYVAVLPSAA